MVRLDQQANLNSREFATSLPRMGFEIKGLSYDASRKLTRVQKYSQVKTGEDGKKYYCVYGEVDSTQLNNDDILYLYINDVPRAMNLGELFETAGITQNSTLQPQYFLGGSFLDPTNPDDPNTDTSIKVPMYSVVNDQVKRFFVKPINTEAIWCSNISSFAQELFPLED